MFASVISALSWDNVNITHWSARANFYSSIIFALMSVILGAQQIMTLPDVDDNAITAEDALELKLLLERHPTSMKFAYQCPIMLFSFSLLTFLAGLFAFVFGPLGTFASWGPDAKVRRITLSTG